MSDDSKLVYSTDSARNRRCPRCRNLHLECECPPEEELRKDGVTATLRIETSGRGGKTVTVVNRLPRSEKYLRELSGYLKARCGAGGTYGTAVNGGFIEIQGDKRDQIRSLLAAEGIACKG